MKKVILTSICGFVSASMAIAQGTFNWSSVSPAAMTAQTNSSTYSPLFGGGSTGSGAVGSTATSATGFYYALLYAAYSGSQAAKPTSLTALSTVWTATGLTANNSTATAGRLIVSGTTGTSVTVPWATGVTNSVMLVGWSANLGTTWSSALSSLNSLSFSGPGYFGMSNTGYLAAGGADPGTTVFATAGTLHGLPINSLNTQLYLVPVPEPSTIALAGLGGLGLLALRRRNKRK